MNYENKALTGGQYKIAEEKAIERIKAMGLPWKDEISPRVEIMAETTVSAQGKGFLLSGFGTSDITEGETYRVYWNGKAYDCQAYKYSGFLTLGNSFLVDSSTTATGEPFALVMTAANYCNATKSNGNVEDITIMVEIPEKEKLYQIDPCYIKDMYGEAEQVLLENTAVEFAYNEDLGLPCGFISAAIDFEGGKEYKVTFDGVEYSCKAGLGEQEGILGNMGAMTGGDDTGEPFIVVPDTSGVLIVIPLIEATSATLSIKVTEATPLPAKYFPEPAILDLRGCGELNTANSGNENVSMPGISDFIRNARRQRLITVKCTVQYNHNGIGSSDTNISEVTRTVPVTLYDNGWFFSFWQEYTRFEFTGSFSSDTFSVRPFSVRSI